MESGCAVSFDVYFGLIQVWAAFEVLMGSRPVKINKKTSIVLGPWLGTQRVRRRLPSMYDSYKLCQSRPD